MDIVGKVVLKGEAMVEMLKVVEEKVNLFASSPIGATIQDGGKRKRSDHIKLYPCSTLSRISYILVIPIFWIQLKLELVIIILAD